MEGSAEDGIVITNCSSGISQVGYERDTCVVIFDNVTQLWACQFSMNTVNWTKTSCKLYMLMIFILIMFL